MKDTRQYVAHHVRSTAARSRLRATSLWTLLALSSFLACSDSADEAPTAVPSATEAVALQTTFAANNAAGAQPGVANDLSTYDIVVFGDSLSDEGRAFATLANQCPLQNCGYQLHRFTNFFNWFDYFLNDTSKNPTPSPEIDRRVKGQSGAWSFGNYSYNRAFGGATVVTGSNFVMSMLIPAVEDQVNEFISRCPVGNGRPACPFPSTTLAILWGGANDYFNAPNSEDAAVISDLATKVVNTIYNSADSLLGSGSTGITNLLMLNLPPLDRVPTGSVVGESGSKQSFYHQAVAAHNSKLQTAFTQLQSKHADAKITLFDVNAAMISLLDGDIKIKNVTNFTDPCNAASYCPGQAAPDAVTSDEQARTSCGQKQTNCDGRAFMDYVHPTTVVHCTLARLVESQLAAAGYTGFQGNLADCSTMAEDPQSNYSSAATESALPSTSSSGSTQ